ncbi:hypothetical protein PF008_g4773 [Phytophthora fragariae]|uniref:Secreted protein n=1 Tax=Phytophthora fragariae TaxID=53985 RepID=A0A6G0SAB1_9STRA|nr:hypothetical protein PF008_g4773 [Phytophthora fragariae]
MPVRRFRRLLRLLLPLLQVGAIPCFCICVGAFSGEVPKIVCKRSTSAAPCRGTACDNSVRI